MTPPKMLYEEALHSEASFIKKAPKDKNKKRFEYGA